MREHITVSLGRPNREVQVALSTFVPLFLELSFVSLRTTSSLPARELDTPSSLPIFFLTVKTVLRQSINTCLISPLLSNTYDFKECSMYEEIE